MSGAGFTPGPWHFDRDEETIVAEVGAVVASVCMAADFPCLDREKVDEVDLECTANARLIAAAPELYEALQKAREFIVNGKYRHEAEAALAKARGDQ